MWVVGIINFYGVSFMIWGKAGYLFIEVALIGWAIQFKL
jgi:hypothetical protein